MFNEVTVLNVQENRPATADEIGELIADGLLFVNYHLDDTSDDAGKAFVDLEYGAMDKFKIQYEK